MSDSTKRILAVASSGGHWQQMLQIAPAFTRGNVTFAAPDPGLFDSARATLFNAEFTTLKDYNQNEPLKVLMGLFETFDLVRRMRPDVVISTGAAPGLLSLLWGRVFGARTIWVDSIANSEKLSLSGRLACRIAHVVLTQWEYLADGQKVKHWGSVI